MEEWGSVVLTFFEHPHFLWDVTKSLPDLQSSLDGFEPLALCQPVAAALNGRPSLLCTSLGRPNSLAMTTFHICLRLFQSQKNLQDVNYFLSICALTHLNYYFLRHFSQLKVCSASIERSSFSVYSNRRLHTFFLLRQLFVLVWTYYSFISF